MLLTGSLEAWADTEGKLLQESKFNVLLQEDAQ